MVKIQQKKLVNYHIKNGGISRYKNKIFSRNYSKNDSNLYKELINDDERF